MWTYDESQNTNADFLRQFIAFLQSALSQRKTANQTMRCDPVRPEFVPGVVRVPKPIRSDIPLLSPGTLSPGVHTVGCNQWGAISAVDDTGNPMGIRPHECVVLEMCPNPYRER